MELFALLEIFHHIIEHWETKSHENSEDSITEPHDDIAHQRQV